MKRISIYRKLMVVAGCVALVCAADVGVSFADTNTASADVGGTVVIPLTIAKDTDLQFGKFTVVAAGTLLIAPADALGHVPAVTGGVASSATFAAAATPAKFTVTGEPLATYSITLPSTDVTMTSGSNTFLVNTFKSLPDAATPGSGTLADVTGKQTVTVGATANPGAAQAAGIYAGSFDVTVNYN